jgi:hypothetical protein
MGLCLPHLSSWHLSPSRLLADGSFNGSFKGPFSSQPQQLSRKCGNWEERSWNLTENKGPVNFESERSQNFTDNKALTRSSGNVIENKLVMGIPSHETARHKSDRRAASFPVVVSKKLPS